MIPLRVIAKRAFAARTRQIPICGLSIRPALIAPRRRVETDRATGPSQARVLPSISAPSLVLDLPRGSIESFVTWRRKMTASIGASKADAWRGVFPAMRQGRPGLRGSARTLFGAGRRRGSRQSSSPGINRLSGT